MIYKFSDNYISELSEQGLSDLCSDIIKHSYFIQCTANGFNKIKEAIQKCGSMTQRELLTLYTGFKPTKEYQDFLTTIDLELLKPTQEQINVLVNLPSEALIENGMYEWNLYRYLPEIYKHDKDYKNIFNLIRRSIDKGYFIWGNAGGTGNFISYIEKKEEGLYRGMFRYKVFVNFDRDTNNNHTFDGNKNALFNFFCGKEYNHVTDEDIYTLDFDKYVWHSWYKRAIENYYPDELYNSKGVNTTVLPQNPNQRDYFHFSVKTVPGYEKKYMQDFPQKMSKSDFESTTKEFQIDNIKVSEMRLVLLKIAKII